jgi:hypothetical protein
MKITEKVVKIIEIDRKDIENRLIEFHRDMMNDSIEVGEKLNEDELIWQLKEFTENLQRIKSGDFKGILNRGYTMCALGSKCFEYVDSYFNHKERMKDPFYQNQEIMIRVMDGIIWVEDIKESDIDY